MSGEIFLYTEDAKVTDRALTELRKNGFIPIKVADYEAVKIMKAALIVPGIDLDIINRAALSTIVHFGGDISRAFGNKVAAGLLAADTAKSEAP